MRSGELHHVLNAQNINTAPSVFHKTHKTTLTLSPITGHQTNSYVHHEVQYLLLGH
jgi:hypothetical protein